MTEDHDVVEGICHVPKEFADISGNAAGYRLAEEASFEEAMLDMWRAQNGRAQFVRTVRDDGLQPARDYKCEDGTVIHEPEGYVTFFQYRRA